MKINCTICYHSFDEREHSPRIVPKCGHTFCLECIKKITVVSDTNFFSVKCPLCNIKYDLRRVGFVSIDEAFPQNFMLKQQMEQIETQHTKIINCIFHGKPACSVCLTEKCQECRRCCLECVRKNHSECSNENFLPIEQIGKTILISDYTRGNGFYENALNAVIKEYIESFNLLLIKMLESYKANLINFRVSMKLIDPTDLMFDLNMLKLIKNSPDNITVGPYNSNEFEELDNHVKMLRETLESVKCNLETKCIDFITEGFKNLTQAQLKKTKSVEIKEAAYRRGQETIDLIDDADEEIIE